ncbi:MAG: asparagine synthase (glutamine-hydrolyzing) [Eubacterium sp.]|nr:asparagine synthase (glutamine-hydrolyzing) [Eubacterium sp.]
MCGIAGYFQRIPNTNATQQLETMKTSLKHRGPDDWGSFVTNNCGLCHTRLSIRDLSGGRQPMTRTFHGRTATIVYNGEIYNLQELKYRLLPFSIRFEGHSDTEVILYCYLVFGAKIFSELNGIFAFAIYEDNRLLLCRDHIGVKPLFYWNQKEEFVFASEIKGIFSYGVTPKIDQNSWCEIIGLGPAHTPGNGVFQGINEVLPGHYLLISSEGFEDHCYWRLKSLQHTESYEETISHCSFLIEDSIKRQMVSDIPICTFLSGGLDSSLVTAIVAKEFGETPLTTFSFDFVDNQKNFKANPYQCSMDRPFVDLMKDYVNSKHHYLECDSKTQLDCLYRTVDARDMPCMADVEASMLYFCSIVAKECKVTLTGECADEIFGGYPWFHKKDLLEKNTFPWSFDLPARTALFQKDFIKSLPLEEYISLQYHQSMDQCPLLESDSSTETKRRKMSWLNIRWFMMTLLNRMDRCSMYSGLEARVPYADYRILEYVFNIPWEYKCYRGQTKSLIVECGKKYLPKEILYRKKSPYPKTYDPGYELLLGKMLLDELHSNASLQMILDSSKVEQFVSAPKDYGKPWFGQLMAGPQLLAYLLQIGYWMRKYHLSV